MTYPQWLCCSYLYFFRGLSSHSSSKLLLMLNGLCSVQASLCFSPNMLCQGCYFSQSLPPSSAGLFVFALPLPFASCYLTSYASSRSVSCCTVYQWLQDGKAFALCFQWSMSALLLGLWYLEDHCSLSACGSLILGCMTQLHPLGSELLWLYLSFLSCSPAFVDLVLQSIKSRISDLECTS